ncbi:MAG: MATE family efflux transporter [Prevotella sp.]|uniref:MATE family efflux transporter n=1 Tax=Prevotella sp. TaxID=59823 RepID=UPI002A32A878|nr:MATE family efflux transporter [Prevotella sp.]MDD7317591.1 MATE family efflux transporter [Prevotellaceae bacterium]MDY4020562.1 MATE family efflux transporter [Prevotella sp.]
MDKRKATLALGTEPVGRLLLKYATPAIVAMMASSLYNMIDSIFIGQSSGPMAISGLAITFPLMNLSTAFGSAIGIGSSTTISVKLGQRDYETAKKILANTVMLNIIIGISFGAVCLLFLNPILRLFGATDNTLPYAREYMTVLLIGTVITHLYFGLNAILRAASKPKVAMYATMFTVVLNTLLAPLFIYGFGMGIRGAAIATVISQACALLWQLRIFSDKSEILHLTKGEYKLRSDIVKNIFAIGMSPFSMNACSCVVVILINTTLVKHGGDVAVGAYAIVNRISFIFFMVVMGINQGMQPIAGYNYGAQKQDRLMLVLKIAWVAATLFTITGFLIGELAPYACARMFTTDEQLIDMAIHGMRICLIFFPTVGFQAVTTNFFQSIGKAKVSIFLALSRQIIFLLPLLLILPISMGVDGVWWSLPAADGVSFIVTLIIMITYMRKARQETAN